MTMASAASASATTPCIVCSALVPTDALEAHVVACAARHFDDAGADDDVVLVATPPSPPPAAAAALPGIHVVDLNGDDDTNAVGPDEPCPLCGRTVTAVALEVHVNACLDAAAATATADPGPSSLPVKRQRTEDTHTAAVVDAGSASGASADQTFRGPIDLDAADDAVECFVCGAHIAGDIAALEAHVNACLDGQAAAAAPAPPAVDVDASIDAGGSLVRCPDCSYEVAPADLAQHTAACLAHTQQALHADVDGPASLGGATEACEACGCWAARGTVPVGPCLHNGCAACIKATLRNAAASNSPCVAALSCPVSGCGRALSLFELARFSPDAQLLALLRAANAQVRAGDSLVDVAAIADVQGLADAFARLHAASKIPVDPAPTTSRNPSPPTAPAPQNGYAGGYDDVGEDDGDYGPIYGYADHGYNYDRSRRRGGFPRPAPAFAATTKAKLRQETLDKHLGDALTAAADALARVRPRLATARCLMASEPPEGGDDDAWYFAAVVVAAAAVYVIATAGRKALDTAVLPLMRDSFQAMSEREPLFSRVFRLLDELASEELFLFAIDGFAPPPPPTAGATTATTSIGAPLTKALTNRLKDICQQAEIFRALAAAHPEAVADEGEAATAILALPLQAAEVTERLNMRLALFRDWRGTATVKPAAPELTPAPATPALPTPGGRASSKASTPASVPTLVPTEEAVAAYMRVLADERFKMVELDVDAHAARPHHQRGPLNQTPTLAWSQRVHRELTSLCATLPVEWSSSIFVRADATRMDLLRALIIGPEGTPYQDGCFLFDIWLPPQYPTVPPLIKFRTTYGNCIRFNPNLYSEGKVCLSLLGTWAGPGWTTKSTLLQVRVA